MPKKKNKSKDQKKPEKKTAKKRSVKNSNAIKQAVSQSKQKKTFVSKNTSTNRSTPINKSTSTNKPSSTNRSIKILLGSLILIGTIVICLVLYSIFRPQPVENIIEKYSPIIINKIIMVTKEKDEPVHELPDSPDSPSYYIEQGSGKPKEQPSAQQQPGQASPDETSTLPESYTECTDSDNGKAYYIKGEATGYWIADIEPFDYAPTTQEDWCIANVLTEMICKSNVRPDQTIPRMVGVTFTCPHGCSNGACLCTTNAECSPGFECNDGVCS